MIFNFFSISLLKIEDNEADCIANFEISNLEIVRSGKTTIGLNNNKTLRIGIDALTVTAQYKYENIIGTTNFEIIDFHAHTKASYEQIDNMQIEVTHWNFNKDKLFYADPAFAQCVTQVENIEKKFGDHIIANYLTPYVQSILRGIL